MPRNSDYPNYTGLKVDHMGPDPRDYHHPRHQHPGQLQKTSEERALKAKPRRSNDNKPKPSTKILDLSTGKSKEIQKAVNKDLKARNIKPENQE